MNPSNVIQRRANKYLRHYVMQGYLTYRSEEQLDELDSSLNEITSDHDRYCYLTLIKNAIEAGVRKYQESYNNSGSHVEEINEDFLYDLQNRLNQITRYEDSLSTEELLGYNTYLDGLTNRIRSLELELDEYQQEAINEIANLRMDLEQLTKRQSEKQVIGTCFKVGGFLTKAGLNHKEITTIITKDWDTIPETLSNTYDLAKTMLG